MLVPPESSSAVLVMIRSKSVSICNHSRAKIIVGFIVNVGNVFYPTFTNVFFIIFSTFFTFLTFFLIFISTFITSMGKLTLCISASYQRSVMNVYGGADSDVIKDHAISLRRWWSGPDFQGFWLHRIQMREFWRISGRNLYTAADMARLRNNDWIRGTRHVAAAADVWDVWSLQFYTWLKNADTLNSGRLRMCWCFTRTSSGNSLASACCSGSMSRKRRWILCVYDTQNNISHTR